jgi:DegV family protein with EDD domain
LAIAIVTDSTSDIEPENARAAGVQVVPLFVRFGDRSFRDYLDLSRAEFYHLLATERDLPNTSQPTSQMFEDVFRPHVEARQSIVCLNISAKLSGTINAARSAAAQFPGAPITVVDSETTAGGLRLLVLRAVQMANAGASVDDVVAYVERQKKSQALYACIADLSHVVRTGRIGKAKAALGTLMRIVPVIALRDGEVVAEAQVRTMNRARETMIDLALRSIIDPAQASFLVMHTNAPQLAAQIQARLRERVGVEPKTLGILEAGPAIATHAGPGAVGVFCAQD